MRPLNYWFNLNMSVGDRSHKIIFKFWIINHVYIGLICEFFSTPAPLSSAVFSRAIVNPSDFNDL